MYSAQSVEIIEIWGMILRQREKAQELKTTLKDRECSNVLMSPHGGKEMAMKLLKPKKTTSTHDTDI